LSLEAMQAPLRFLASLLRGRDHEQRQQGAEQQAADDHPADGLAASAPAPVARASGIAPSTMAPVVIRIGRRRSAEASTTASSLIDAQLAQLVRELDDQDAVLGDQAHQHHQTDLAVHVQRAVPVSVERISSAPAIASGTVNMMTKGPTKLSNCAASTR
jgi:hypothetical protein